MSQNGAAEIRAQLGKGRGALARGRIAEGVDGENAEDEEGAPPLRALR